MDSVGSGETYEISVMPPADQLSLSLHQESLSVATEAFVSAPGSPVLEAEQSAECSTLPLASPKYDSVRTSIKSPADDMAAEEEMQASRGRTIFLNQQSTASRAISTDAAFSAFSVPRERIHLAPGFSVESSSESCAAVQVNDGARGRAIFQGQQATVSRGILSEAACSASDPRERIHAASGSPTGADPGELEFDSASFQSLGRSLSKADYSAPRHAFCARSLLSRSSEAIFFSTPPGRGPIFPSWTSARALFTQEQTWKPLFSGVFDHKKVVCHKWDMHVAPILGRMFQIEGHPNWLLQGHFVDDVARADAFALCLDLYKRASYYLSPASMLWWVLARAQAATGEELGAIGDRPNRLHQVPQSSPVKMIESYARLAEGANGVDPFWDQVWSLAVELLAAQPSVVGPAAPRTRRGVTSVIAPCVWGPHERKGSGPPDPGLTALHLFRWELEWEIFYPTSRLSFVSEGKITSRDWEHHAAPRLLNVFGISSSLSPHWAQSGHINENARAKSFRLCLRLYSKAAYFLSPAMFLWWAIARVTARTVDELRDVGPHPRRLSAGAQQVPVAMLEGYREMVAHSSTRSNFWRDVWGIALNLLAHGSLPGGASSSRGPRLINTSIPDPTTWSTGAARVTGSEFSSVTDGDGPAFLLRKEAPGAGSLEVTPRWGQTGGGEQFPTVPVSWRTGPSSLVGSAFSSDVEGDGPRSCILPIRPNLQGLSSADRRASAAIICQRLWRRRARPVSLPPASLGAGGGRLIEDRGGSSRPSAYYTSDIPPRGLPSKRAASPGASSPCAVAVSQNALGKSPAGSPSVKRRKRSQAGASSGLTSTAVGSGDNLTDAEASQRAAPPMCAPRPTVAWETPLPGRLTFWVLAGTVGSSPVGEGRNPAVGDLLVSTLVYCSGYGPISSPFDPFLSAQSFSPGDWLGHLAMTHWGLWAMTATVLTCAPLMEITLNLVGPHPCGFNTRLVEFVATLADFRGALGSPVSIVRCANSEDCPVDPVSQRSLYCMLWDSPASGPVLRPLRAVDESPDGWEEWVWNSSRFGLDSPLLPGFPVKLPRPSLAAGHHPRLSSYFEGVPPLSWLSGRLSTSPDWRGVVNRFRGCPALAVHLSARVVKGDPTIFVVGVVLNGTFGLQLRVHTQDGTEAFPLLPLAPLLDWVCLWAGGLLIRSLTPAPESSPSIIVASPPSRDCYNPLVREDLRRLAMLFIDLSILHEPRSPLSFMAGRIALLGASGCGPFLFPVQQFPICVSNQGDVFGHISDQTGQLDRDARRGAAWVVLSTPSIVPSACGCHPDWSLGSSRSSRQWRSQGRENFSVLSLSINVECDYDYHQECPGSVVGVICGPESEVRVLFPDLGLLPGNPVDRHSWVTCFLMLHLLTTLDGLVHVCIAGGPLWGDGTLASEHLFFVAPMLEALKAFRGHITFATCSGHWSNNTACRYSTFVISSLLPTLGAGYNPSCGIHWDVDREVWVNQHFLTPGLADFSFPDTFPFPSPHLASPLDLDPSLLVHTRLLCERLGLWLFPPTLLATVPNVGDLACLCRADSNALVGPLFPVPPGIGCQVWPTEAGDPRFLHKWRAEHDCAQLTVFFPDGLYNPISLSPKVSSPLLPFMTRMLGTLSLPGGWMVLHGTKPLRRQTTPSELGVRAGWRFRGIGGPLRLARGAPPVLGASMDVLPPV